MVIEDDGTLLTILDTRPCALAYRTTLGGVEREICLLCDDAPAFESVVSRVARRCDVPPETVRAAIAQMAEQRLLLLLDGHVITLAVPGPLPVMPSDYDFPGGLLHEDEAAAVASAT